MEGTPTKTVESQRAGDTLVRQFHLRVVEGPDLGLEHTSAGARTVIGTHRSANLVLHDPTVSRFHCEITVGDETVVLRDLGSRNGTRVNGVAVLAAPLEPNVVITVGKTRLQCHAKAERVRIPLSTRERFGALVGNTVPMRRAFAMLESAARSDATVLLQGETGTGKDLAASAVHDESERRDGPFVVVDCGAIAPALVDSELFGHERGAFTGADRLRIGAFESAGGGTLFLDEIGDLDLALQPKLLRALEQREIVRVGAVEPRAVDVRIIAATNRDLRAEVNAGRFRSDLYYRLSVIEIVMPPLRERADDVPVIVDELLAANGTAESAAAAALRRPEALARLCGYTWPGNVRELRNYVERCCAIDGEAELSAAGQPAAPAIDVRQPLRLVRERSVRAVERAYLEALLAAHGGNVSAAARAAGVARVHMHRLLSRYGIR